jgi:hypothetical protein
MPNGKRFSGASGTAEFASSAIAFRIDCRLKPRPERFCESVPSRAMNDARGGDDDALRQADLCTARRRSDQEVIKERDGKNFAPEIPRQKFCAPIELFIGRWPT